MPLLLNRLLRVIQGVSLLVSLSFAVLPVLAGPVRYIHVSGQWRDGVATVVWEEYGYDTLAGYRVYRIEKDEAFALQKGWLPTDFNRTGGASYYAADPAVKGPQDVVYQLQGLVEDGSIIDLGIWEVEFPDPRDVPESVWVTLEEPIVAPAAEVGPGPAVKVPVLDYDIYRVPFGAIADGLGLSEQTVAAMAANTNLAMHTAGAPVAYSIAGDHVLFYGWPVTNRYTITNYFWIEPGVGMHMDVRLADAVSVSSNLTHTGVALFRQRGIMTPDQFSTLPDDFYFWAGFGGSTPRSYDVALPGIAGGDMEVRVWLRGWRDNVQHHARISFNDEEIGIVDFADKQEVVGAFSTTGDVSNTLAIQIIQPDDGTVSSFVTRKFEVDYERYYAAIGALLLAGDAEHERLTAARYEDPIVLDVSNPRMPVWIEGPTGVSPDAYSWEVSEASLWAMRERAEIPVTAPMPGGFGSWMLAETNRVDYLVIAPRAFQGPAQALATYREAMGLRTAVALFEDICDHFAFGLGTPDAIRDMLAYAHEHWAVAPWMVVLGGRGHFDYLNALPNSTQVNHLPPIMGYDSFRLRAADLFFADLNGDEVPDFALGRIPAQTEQQFYDYLQKVQEYEAGLRSENIDRVLFVADKADDAGDFAASNEVFANIVTNRYTAEATVLEDDSSNLTAVRSTIANAIQSGYGILHYTGHGSYNSLAHSMLTRANVDSYGAHDPVTLVLSLTCDIGRFDDYRPAQKSLAEALVMKPSGGALAVYAPAGLSYNVFAQQMAEVLYDNHAHNNIDTIGSLLYTTRQQVGPTVGLQRQAYRTYNLLGDPALRLREGEIKPPAVGLDRYAKWRWESMTWDPPAEPGQPPVPSAAPAEISTAVYAFGTDAPQLQFERKGAGMRIVWPQRRNVKDVQYRLLMASEPGGPWLPAGDDLLVEYLDEEGDVLFRHVAAEPNGDAQRLFFRLEAVLE